MWRLATKHDFDAILAMQRANLERTVGPDEARTQGYVTVVHTHEILERMHALMPSVVVDAPDGSLAGYALAMHVDVQGALPILAPMFARLARLSLPRFYVMGQVCVARAHRGQGVFEALYAGHRATYAREYGCVVTDIALRNARSMRAHARVGFAVEDTYRDDTDEWAIVVWRW